MVHQQLGHNFHHSYNCDCDPDYMIHHGVYLELARLPPTSGTATVLGIYAAADPIAVKASGLYSLAPSSLNRQGIFATWWD